MALTDVIARQEEKENTRGKSAQAVFIDGVHEGQRMSVGEWAKFIYGKDTKEGRASIYSAKRRALLQGRAIVFVWKDPDDWTQGKILVPMTEERAYVRAEMESRGRKIDAAILGFSLHATQRVAVFPDMAGEIAGIASGSLDELISYHKILLETKKPIYVPKLQSGAGTRK